MIKWHLLELRSRVYSYFNRTTWDLTTVFKTQAHYHNNTDYNLSIFIMKEFPVVQFINKKRKSALWYNFASEIFSSQPLFLLRNALVLIQYAIFQLGNANCFFLECKFIYFTVMIIFGWFWLLIQYNKI